MSFHRALPTTALQKYQHRCIFYDAFFTMRFRSSGGQLFPCGFPEFAIGTCVIKGHITSFALFAPAPSGHRQVVRQCLGGRGGRGGASPVRRSEAVVSWSSLKAVVVSWSSLKASLFIYPRSVALASRSHIDHPFNIAIGPLGIWSFSVLQTRKNLGAPRITYVKHRVYAGATKSHNSCFVGQSWIGV